MEGETLSGLGNRTLAEGNALHRFNRSFGIVQNILDQNRLLINEINQNHESMVPGKISRNVGLIRELNNNIRRVVDLYSDLSSSFERSMEDSCNGDCTGTLSLDAKDGHKRVRSV